MQKARLKTAYKLEQHWLDFGINKYTPYALQGGATDLHMPFIIQVPLPLQAMQIKLTACLHAMIKMQDHLLCHMYMLLTAMVKLERHELVYSGVDSQGETCPPPR